MDFCVRTLIKNNQQNLERTGTKQDTTRLMLGYLNNELKIKEKKEVNNLIIKYIPGVSKIVVSSSGLDEELKQQIPERGKPASIFVVQHQFQTSYILSNSQ